MTDLRTSLYINHIRNLGDKEQSVPGFNLKLKVDNVVDPKKYKTLITFMKDDFHVRDRCKKEMLTQWILSSL